MTHHRQPVRWTRRARLIGKTLTFLFWTAVIGACLVIYSLVLIAYAAQFWVQGVPR